MSQNSELVSLQAPLYGLQREEERREGQRREDE